MKRVLITGACGFVGRHTCREFARNGWRIVALDANTEKCPDAAETIVVGSILNAPLLHQTVAENKVAGIVHCASIIREQPCMDDPIRAVQVNVEGTAVILEAAKTFGIPVTHLSTATLYGRDPELKPLHESEEPHPVGLYDTTKLMAETLCKTYRSHLGVDVVMLRTGFVYGDGQPLDSYFVPAAFVGRPVTEPDGADHPVDYTYVKDLARGIFLCHTTRPLSQAVYNVTGGVLRLRRDYIRAVKEHFPKAAIDVGPGTTNRTNLRGPAVLDAARRDFGYSPAFDLESGIADWVADLSSVSERNAGV